MWISKGPCLSKTCRRKNCPTYTRKPNIFISLELKYHSYFYAENSECFLLQDYLLQEVHFHIRNHVNIRICKIWSFENSTTSIKKAHGSKLSDCFKSVWNKGIIGTVNANGVTKNDYATLQRHDYFF